MRALNAWWGSERRAPLIFALKSLGFIASFAASALMLAFVAFELHYDAWNPAADRIARAVETRDVGSGAGYTSLPYAFADAALERLPGITAAARVQPLRVMVQRGRDRFDETLFFVDPSFLAIFPVSVVAGGPRPLDRPGSMLISERAARKYFGDDDPIGKTLALGGTRDVTISAVMRDWPADSHMHPDFVLSLDTFFSIAQRAGADKVSITGWSNCHCYATYLLFDSRAALARARSAVAPLLVSERGADYAATFPITLQPLPDVYLGSGAYVSYLNYALQGDRAELAVFASVAALLLLISSSSFANFATAQTTVRAAELAVRRLLGARSWEIAAGLTAEAAASALLAAVLGFALALCCARWFGAFVDRPIDGAALLHSRLVARLAGIALAVGVLSGLAPGLVAARVHPLALLRGRLGSGESGPSGRALRRGLVALQFVASFVLIVFALAIRGQLSYADAEARLGFDPRGVLVMNAEGSEAALGELVGRLSVLPGVRSVAIANAPPTTPLSSRVGVVRDGSTGSAAQALFLDRIGFGYLRALGVRILAGRDFDAAYGADRLEEARYAAPPTAGARPTVDAIVNRVAARGLGFSSPQAALGGTLRFADDSYAFGLRIVGVADDVRYGGPRETVKPMLYLARTDWNVNLHEQRYLVVRTDDPSSAALRDEIRETWNRLVPGFVGRVDRLRERVERQTEGERRQLGLVAAFTGLGVVLSVFGSLGVTALSMTREARGLAIRRVFGAKRAEIAVLVSMAELRSVAAGILLGCPIALAAVGRWLDGFVLRAPISVWWFVAGGAAIAAVSFLTLLAFTFRLTAASPVEQLRSA